MYGHCISIEKKIPSALMSAILTHFEKKIENQILPGSIYSSCCLKILTIIVNFENESISLKFFIDDSINCTFIC